MFLLSYRWCNEVIWTTTKLLICLCWFVELLKHPMFKQGWIVLCLNCKQSLSMCLCLTMHAEISRCWGSAFKTYEVSSWGLHLVVWKCQCVSEPGEQMRVFYYTGLLLLESKTVSYDVVLCGYFNGTIRLVTDMRLIVMLTVAINITINCPSIQPTYCYG